MKLEIESKILVGSESKAWLADLSNLIARMEKLQKLSGGGSGGTTSAVDDDEDEDEAPKALAKTKGKKAKVVEPEDDEDELEASSDDEDEEENESAEASEEDEEEEKPAKAAKGKKAARVTIDDVNDACKAKALSLIEAGQTGPEARKAVLKLLKKKFGISSSVTELEPEQYADAVKALKV